MKGVLLLAFLLLWMHSFGQNKFGLTVGLDKYPQSFIVPDFLRGISSDYEAPKLTIDLFTQIYFNPKVYIPIGVSYSNRSFSSWLKSEDGTLDFEVSNVGNYLDVYSGVGVPVVVKKK